MTVSKTNLYFHMRLLIAVCVFVIISFVAPLTVSATDTAEPKYIYFDLSAGDVTITGKKYTGYRYDGSETRKEISGTLSDGEVYYVYQSNGEKNTGVIDGVFVRPAYTNNRVTYQNQTWGQYITDHPKDKTDGDATGPKSGSASVLTVIEAWETAVASTRSATSHSIKFSGNVGKIEMVLDNLWSNYQTKSQHRTHGSIGYNTYGEDYENNEITLKLRGDNRLANVFYATKAKNGLNDPEFNDTKNRLIFDCYGTETDATLTVANNKGSDGGQWWNAAIGSSDSYDACCGLVFNCGIIYAGTTAADDCTAIGGGGNGAATIEINGGTVTAVSSTSGSAIGGGIGKSAQGGSANITINGGNVYAYNFGYGQDYAGKSYTTIVSSAIGGGSSSAKSGCKYAQVTINGGNVYAQSVGGTAIGGGSSTKSEGGNAEITINGGEVTAKSIGGTLFQMSTKTKVDINPGVAIGGGTGNGKGGYAKLTVNENNSDIDTKLYTGSIGGGGYTAATGSIGAANVIITGGDVQGQVVMSGKDSTFEMTGGNINNIDSQTSGFSFVKPHGGAIFMEAPNGETTISGGTIQNCSAENGGAVYMTQGTLALSDDGSISNCTASNNGGAIYLGGGTVMISGGTIAENTAANGNGGGIYLGGGTMTVSNGSITNNSAKNGGGAYVNAGSADYGILVTGGSITNNTADQNGGGVAVNNGYYKMTGGNVDSNTATTGNGGGIYVSSTDIKVNVSVFSGSVTNNRAGTSGGAVAVSGGSDSDIQVTLGVNLKHGENIQCDHDDDNNRTAYTCPVIESNHAGKSGGAIYIIGGKSTKLDTFCLVEHKDRANFATATPGSSTSNFMMVEGGTVHLSTANADNSSSSLGNIKINGTIHVNAGDMTIDGSMANPMINATITVDVTTERGSFTDNRKNPVGTSPEETYYKVQYFENFLDPVTQKKTGQYKVFQVLTNSVHTILPTLYQHDGYMIDGWWTTEFSDDAGSIEYEVNKGYTITEDLILYAKWLPIGYYVYFSPGTDSYDGSMETVRYNWDVTESLPQNKFFNKGYIFVGWDRDNDGNQDYTDKQSVVNLTQERSITLTAVWTLCDHQEAYFTYSTSGANTLVRTCSCKACTQRATLTAENKVYDPNADPYQAKLIVVTNVSNGQSSDTLKNWSPTPQYEGYKYDGTEFAEGEFRKAAGKYTVSISDSDNISVTVPFEILKAKRISPAKPLFKSNETDGSVDKGKIVIIPPQNDPLYDYLEYHVEWYVAGGDKQVSANKNLLDSANNAAEHGFDLSANYTNYYVYAQYRGDNNYYDSEWVVADSVLFYTGNVYFIITCQDGITYSHTSLDNAQGLVINVSPKLENNSESLYYLYNTVVTHDKNSGYTQDITITKESNSTHVIRNIPASPQTGSISIYLTITGVKKCVQITHAVTASEKFNTISGEIASINFDSAYTAYFEIQNYDVYENPKLVFNQALPANTAVIFVDKTKMTPVYYSYKVGETATSEIALSNFKRMGVQSDVNTKYTPPNSSDAALKYQFVVDFSDSVGGSNGNLTTTFTADCSSNNSNMGAPAFPASTVTVTLSHSVTSSVTVDQSSANTEKKIVTINYLNTSGNVTASKWDNRSGALVLTWDNTSEALPPDARIKVTDKNGSKVTCYPNVDGWFVISLSELQSPLTLELVSDLFPIVTATYTFSGKLISACSLAGSAYANGTLLVGDSQYSPIIVSFSTDVSDAEPSLKININGDQKVYAVGSTVTVHIDAKNIPQNTRLRLRLQYKESDSGTYQDTGIKSTISNTEITDSAYYGNMEISFGEAISAGSYRFLLDICDNIYDDSIISVPYYFVITDNRPNT